MEREDIVIAQTNVDSDRIRMDRYPLLRIPLVRVGKRTGKRTFKITEEGDDLQWTPKQV